MYHPEWLANPVLVQKKNKEWRMCVDYTDLNKHCPKDPFGLPLIDEVVDSTAGCELLFFLEGDLVIAGVTIEEVEQFIAGGGVYNLIYLRQT